MALQGDQRALLQLICERDQSYADIAGLLDTTPEGVRSKARAALAELGGADPDAEVGLTDYLLGQADPIGRADAVRHLQADPDARALAERIAEGLREIAPNAKLPKLPEPRGRTRRAAVPTGADDEATRSPEGRGDVPARTTSSRQSRTIAILAAVGVILVVAILAIAGVFGGDDGDGGGTSATAATTPETTSEDGTQTQDVTEVDLRPTNESGVAGTATFGIANESQLFVDVTLDGLDPDAPRDSTYFIWMMIGDTGGYPLNQPLQPDENGRFSGRIAISAPVAATVAPQATTLRVSLSPIRELGKAAQQAAKDQVPIVPFTGDELAAGEIPLADQQGE